ncbi:MAG: sodium:calcium antiporter [Candidatus Thorarchaeota archaeon]
MWEIILWLLIFIGSYLIIFFAADFFLDNLKDVCIIYKLSPFIIGMLILGIDPEESIASIIGAINNLPYISMGNVIGNSIIAMTLPFALPLLTKTINFKPMARFFFLLLYFLMLIVLFGFMINYMLFFSGLLDLAGYTVYIIRNFQHYNKEKEIESESLKQLVEDELNKLEKASKSKKIFYVFLGLFFIFIGGEILVFSAEKLIDLFNIPEIFFGFIIIGFVTNVEEITLMIKSIKKKSVEIGFGGMIGKLIWNLSITFGISGLIIINLEFNWILIWNWLILVAIIIYFNILSLKGKLEKKDGFLLISIFAFFIILNSLLF